MCNVRDWLFLGCCVLAALPVWGKIIITDLRVQQRWPWNGLVDISYRVASDDGSQQDIHSEVTVRFRGHDRDRNQPFALKTVTGDGIERRVGLGGPYHVVWNLSKDYPTFNSTAFQVTAVATVHQYFQSKRRYLVIDLSGGPTAKSYPWRYSETGPDVTGDACRTTELWLREIPAGTFMMGSPADELGRMPGEDLHSVTLTKSFFMGIFEITQRQWELVMGSNPSGYPGGDRPMDGLTYDQLRGNGNQAGAGWPSQGHVVDGSSFLGALQSRTGLLLDLPTDAQWEYACRAGTTTSLNSGENLVNSSGRCPHLDQLGRYWENCNDGRGGYDRLARVGSYRPNAWGLYDMHGNVHEWCLDWYQESLGSLAATDPVGPASGTERVLRGGYWHDLNARYCRSALRHHVVADQYVENRGSGCRVVFLPNESVKPSPDKPTESGRYLVIDLSGGATATTYPHRYSETGPDVTSDTCRTTELWLREIPAGTFRMGSPADELGFYGKDEDPHQVTLTNSYFVGVFEVTQKQWELVMGNNPSSGIGDDRPVERVSFEDIRGNGKAGGAGWPVHGYAVDSQSFMGTLRAKTGLLLDLPTEAQWEFACRAGTTSTLNSGKNLTVADGYCPNAAEVGRYKYNRTDGRGGYSDTHTRVGSYLPNAWGLYDMHGNVWEWCLDWYEKSWGNAAVTDPVGPEQGSQRVFRSISFYDFNLRVGSRSSDGYPSSRYYNVGFRVAYLPHEAMPLKPDAKTTSGKYLVIDLSGGMEAVTYPHRYSETGPDLNGDACRTTELWLREIPAGTFMMGSPENELGRDGDQEDLHQVTLTKPFRMGVFEVTQKQWELVMGSSNPSYAKGKDRPLDSVSYDVIRGTGATAGAGWPAHGHKVDAASFLGKLQAKTGLVLDLPTEAQWEYACRAGTTTALNSGKNLTTTEGRCPNLDQLGRYSANQKDGRGGSTDAHTRVGSYQPNAWGLYDMHGNVAEWCLDWYLDHLGTSAVTDPVGAASGSHRLLRGGGWGYSVMSCRGSSRDRYYPTTSFYSYFGFRVACP